MYRLPIFTLLQLLLTCCGHWTSKIMENSLLSGTKLCLENFHPFFLEFSSELCICEWQNRGVAPPARINSSAIKMHSACAGTSASADAVNKAKEIVSFLTQISFLQS